MINVGIKKLNPDAVLPVYMHEGDAGCDVAACLSERCLNTNGISRSMTLAPYTTTLVPTGLILSMPNGYECQVRSRSGLALKGVVVANSPGTIDAGYCGEVKVMLYNNTDGFFHIKQGDRIAQLVFMPVTRAEFHDITELPETARSTGGFGSTGV